MSRQTDLACNQKMYSETVLWFKPNIFDSSLLLNELSLNEKNLKQIISLCHLLNTDFPYLKDTSWRNIAQKLLKISAPLAELYAETLVTISLQCQSEPEKELGFTQLNVYSLIILLYIQNISTFKYHPSSKQFSVEHWPTSSTSFFDIKQNQLEEKQFHFIKDKIWELISILCKEGNKVTLDIIKALDLLIEGHSISDNKQSIRKTLSSLAQDTNFADLTGFDINENCFDFTIFCSWIQNSLQTNPYGTSSLLICIPNDSWGLKCSKYFSTSKATMLTNQDMLPNHNKMHYFINLQNITLLMTHSLLENTKLKILRSSHVYLYFLIPLKFVEIDQCKNCTIVLGAVATTIKITNSKSVQVHTVAKRIIVKGCSNVTIYCHTPYSPILLGDSNQNVRFAPHNIFYPLLSTHIKDVCINCKNNLWSKILSSENNFSQFQSKSFIVPPEEFGPFIIPFQKNSKEFFFPLPIEYKKIIKAKDEVFAEWSKKWNDPLLPNEKREKIKAILLPKIRSNFEDWMKQKGHSQELYSLKKYFKES